MNAQSRQGFGANPMDAMACASAVHEGIRFVFLAMGGTPDEWARVAADPRRFNRVWRKALGIEDGDTLPPAGFRDIDPSTGEILWPAPPPMADAKLAGPRPAAEALRHVACTACANWRDGCAMGFHPSLPEETVHLCGRYLPATRRAA